MQTFYFTFPVGHELRDYYVCIESLTLQKARRDFVRRYGDNSFGFMFTERTWINWQGHTHAERFNLREL